MLYNTAIPIRIGMSILDNFRLCSPLAGVDYQTSKSERCELLHAYCYNTGCMDLRQDNYTFQNCNYVLKK